MRVIGSKITTLGSSKNSNITNMEEIDGVGINVDEFIANEKAKGNGYPGAAKMGVGAPPRKPDPMDRRLTAVIDVASTAAVDDGKAKMQWKRGDKTGTVEVVKDEDEEWLMFESGGRISKALKDEFLNDVDPKTPAIDVSAEFAPVLQQEFQKAIIQTQESPVTALLKKSSGKVAVSFALEVQVDAPSPALLAILIDSFGEDAMKDVEEYITAQVDMKALKQAVADKVQKMIDSTAKT